MSAPVLVCFAVPQEAKPFQKLARHHSNVRVLLTGMGARNAERAIRIALNDIHPAAVFTCGFAGALNPDLRIADVVGPSAALVVGARPAVFILSERVAVTAAEKSALRARTGADVVEMESAIIERECQKAGVPCTTVRVISDEANEDLPLDFNALMTHDQRLSMARLIRAVLKAPQKTPSLMRLGKNSARAAGALAQVLDRAISDLERSQGSRSAVPSTSRSR